MYISNLSLNAYQWLQYSLQMKKWSRESLLQLSKILEYSYF